MLLEVLEILGRASLPSKKPTVGCRRNNSSRARSSDARAGTWQLAQRRVGGFTFYPCKLSLGFYPRNHPGAILAVFKQAQVAGPALQGFGSCQPAKTRWEALALPRCGLQKINNKYFFFKQNNQTGTLPSSLREQGKREQLGQPRRTDTKGKPRGKELFFRAGEYFKVKCVKASLIWAIPRRAHESCQRDAQTGPAPSEGLDEAQRGQIPALQAPKPEAPIKDLHLPRRRHNPEARSSAIVLLSTENKGFILPRKGKKLGGTISTGPSRSYLYTEAPKQGLSHPTNPFSTSNPWMERLQGAGGRPKSRGRVNVGARQPPRWCTAEQPR